MRADMPEVTAKARDLWRFTQSLLLGPRDDRGIVGVVRLWRVVGDGSSR